MASDAVLISPYALGEWHVYQGATNDCGPYCAALAANTLLASPALDPVALARRMARPARLLPDRIPGWATFPWGVTRVLRGLGLRARWQLGARPADLRAQLARGSVTIVMVGQPWRIRQGRWRGWAHYKALCGWDPQRGWAFIDPGKPTGEPVWQTPARFAREWAALGRQLIEVWRECDA